MHELTVTRSIYRIVQKHAIKNAVRRVLSVDLEIGALSDLQKEWVQKYFDHLSRGSVAEGAELRITKVPAVFKCNRCRRSFSVTSLMEEELCCSTCGSREITLTSGREYRVKSMEAH